jgi:hypothetical protein
MHHGLDRRPDALVAVGQSQNPEGIVAVAEVVPQRGDVDQDVRTKVGLVGPHRGVKRKPEKRAGGGEAVGVTC